MSWVFGIFYLLSSSTFTHAFGAPPPNARAAALEDSLSSPGSFIPASPAPHAASPKPQARVLLLDEPTASLDLRYQIEIASVIKELHERRDVSIVLSTHDVHFARAVCNDVVLLREGRVLARGPAAAVLTPDRLGELYGIDVSSRLAGALT